ncbi:hypothetical protein ACW9H6_28295 [Pseudomonas sp. SDO528_S397]
MFIVKTSIKTASHIGGAPILPKGVATPKSDNGIPLTFFFTIQFPEGHTFYGYALSFFCATDEFDEDFSIPEMLDVVLKGAIIPDGFLNVYQKFFKVYLFKVEDAVALEPQSNIARQYLTFSDDEVSDIFGWIGKVPKWLLEDESPSMYEGQNLDFLFQVKKDQVFEILNSAPPQKEVNIFGGEKDREQRNYFFFNKNEVFFFGVFSKSPNDNVYIITQCD